MRSRRAFLAMLSAAVFVMGGCEANQARPADDTASASSQLLADFAQVVGGNLDKVDLEAKTFTLMTADAPQTFTFTDATEVTGAAGTQGLAGREGARATVHFRDEQGAKIAVRIVLE